MKYVLILSLFFIGCVSKPSRPLSVYRLKLIKTGMTENEVKESMPDVDQKLTAKDGHFVYVYENRSTDSTSDNTQDLFIVFDKNGLVKEKEFGPVLRPHGNSGANAAAAFGQALQNSTPQTTNCTSTKDYFGNIQTRCTGE